MSKLIVIIGITGTQGSSVASTFADLPGWQIRGTTRNPSSRTAQELKAKGYDIVKADLDDKGSLIAAFQDANAIFAVTDFWQHFSNPENSPVAAKIGKTINEYAYDLEVVQGINIAEAASDASVIKTLDRFIFSSLSNVRKWSKGKYMFVYHFDSKAKIEEYIKESLPELSARMSTVQIGHYTTNWKMNMASHAPQKQPDGTFTFYRAVGDDKPYPFVTTHLDTGAFVRALVELPPGKKLLGVSETMTWEQWARVWGSTLGVTARIEWVPYEEFMAQYPEVIRAELGQSGFYIAEFTWTGGDPEVLTPNEIGFAIPITKNAEYIRKEDWSSIL